MNFLSTLQYLALPCSTKASPVKKRHDQSERFSLRSHLAFVDEAFNIFSAARNAFVQGNSLHGACRCDQNRLSLVCPSDDDELVPISPYRSGPNELLSNQSIPRAGSLASAMSSSSSRIVDQLLYA